MSAAVAGREWGAQHPDSGKVWGFGTDETEAREFAAQFGTQVFYRTISDWAPAAPSLSSPTD